MAVMMDDPWDSVDERLDALARTVGNLEEIMHEAMHHAKLLQDHELVEQLERVLQETQKLRLH